MAFGKDDVGTPLVVLENLEFLDTADVGVEVFDGFQIDLLIQVGMQEGDVHGHAALTRAMILPRIVPPFS